MKFKFLFIVGFLFFAMAGDLFSHPADPNFSLARYALYASESLIFENQARLDIEMPSAGLVGTNGLLDMSILWYGIDIHFYDSVKVGGQIKTTNDSFEKYIFDSPIIATAGITSEADIILPKPTISNASFTPPVTNSADWSNVWPADSININSNNITTTGDMTLPTGIYGKIIVDDFDTLFLSAGVYEMKELVLNLGAVVMIDKSEIEFTRIFIRDNLDFSELGGKQKILTKLDGDYGKVLIYTTAANIKTPLSASPDFSITLEASLVAPRALITFRNSPIFRGQLLAKKIVLKGDFNAASGSFEPFVTSHISLVNTLVREDTLVANGDDDNVPLTDRSWTKQFEVILGSKLDALTTLDYTITPVTAEAGKDYSTSDGIYTGQLSFSGGMDGNLNAFIPINIIDDSKDEVNETFIIKLHNAIPAGKITFPVGDFSEHTITIIDDDPTNQSPTDISLSNSVIPEESGVGYSVGTLSTTSNASDNFNVSTYSIIGEDQGFQIVGSDLQTAKNFDFETVADRGPFTIKIKSTDNGLPGLSIEKDFTISIDTLNDNAPTQNDTAVTIIFEKATIIEIPTPSDIDYPVSLVSLDSTIVLDPTLGVFGVTIINDTSKGTLTYLGENKYSYYPKWETLAETDEFTYQFLDSTNYDAVNVHRVPVKVILNLDQDSKINPAVISTGYFDTDELKDGIVDRVVVEFHRAIVVETTQFSLTWADSTQIITPIPTTNENSTKLIFDGIYTDSLAKVKTGGVMSLKIIHSLILGSDTASTTIDDRTAPVIVSATMDKENINDTTLTITFSEDLAPVDGLVNYPYSFFDKSHDNTEFTMDLEFQDAPTTNSVKYLASNISIPYVVTGDSIAVEFGNYIFDTNNNVQNLTTKTLLDASFNYRLGINLLVYPQPLVLDKDDNNVIRTKNIDTRMYEFYNLESIGIAKDAGVAFIIEATSPLSIDDAHRGKAHVLDNVGNVVSEELPFQFVVKQNGNLAGVAIWDAKNRKGRIVGRGAYLVAVEAFLIFGDNDKRTKQIVKTVGVRY
jgi:hypothetical protein